MQEDLSKFNSRILKKREVAQIVENAAKIKNLEFYLKKEQTYRDKRYKDRFRAYTDVRKQVVQEMMQKNFDFSLYDPKNDGSNKEAMEKLLKEDQNQY